jgi:hypothetical protein
MENIITPKAKISKFLNENGFEFLNGVSQRRMTEIIEASGMKGNTGKTSDYAECSEVHRTTIGHFLRSGKWKETQVSAKQKQNVLKVMGKTAEDSREAVYCRVDDTISEKKQSSSKATNPTEGTGWHYSHLEKKMVFGHQIFGSTVSCGELALCYELSRYDKAKRSKIEMTLDVADSLPVADTESYALFDSWYTNAKTVNAFRAKNYTVIGALKTNRIIYPEGNRIPISEFVADISIDEFRLVTADNQEKYWVYRYVGNLNKINDVVVLITYPQDCFGNNQALRAFVCTDVSIDSEDILKHYANRWQIEVFFKQMKHSFGLDKFMIRSAFAIDRFLIILSVAYFFYVTVLGLSLSFSLGVQNLRSYFVQLFKFAL